jgi:putative PIN family toxin of toxin-antitoxin system
MRVVFDTNIFVSAFAIPGGTAEEAYLQAVRGKFDLFTSAAILTETANVLRIKFDWSEDKIRGLLGSIAQIATVLKTIPHLDILADKPDNRILECAVMAEAEVIVTGDHHLLALNSYQNISIIKLASFVDRLK